MHHLLYVQEILHEIFCQCYDRDLRQAKSVLVALARTCKTFKEPALDVLWAELPELTPLVQCLPEVSYINSHHLYALKRPLEEADWDVIFGYTRRVRVWCVPYLFLLAPDCVEELSRPPASIPLVFPKLREIYQWGPTKELFRFMRRCAGPSVTTLRLDRMDDLRDAIEALEHKFLNMTTFSYVATQTEVLTNHDRLSTLICQWPKLRSVYCQHVTLNTAALTHLSCIPDLHSLRLFLGPKLVLDDSRSNWTDPSGVSFPALVHCTLCTWSLALARRFLGRFGPLGIKQLRVELDYDPGVHGLEPFLATLPDTCDHESLTDISLATAAHRSCPRGFHNFSHLAPLTVFVNLQTIHLALVCGVDLSEGQLLELALSWPHLEVFRIGARDSCTPSSAITPGGFVRLLERCRLLSEFGFNFDTHGYTEIPQGHPWHGLTMPSGPRMPSIDVRMSTIEEESVEAFGFFFHVAPFPMFRLEYCWSDFEFLTIELVGQYPRMNDRWGRVRSIAHRLWQERRTLLDSLKAQSRDAVHCDG